MTAPEVTPYPKPARPAKKRGRARPDEPLRAVCEVCGDRRATTRHHKLMRSQGGGDEPENTMDVCDPGCHQLIHANPEFSYREGYLIHARPVEEIAP